jgi:hypothetical protein
MTNIQGILIASGTPPSGRLVGFFIILPFSLASNSRVQVNKMHDAHWEFPVLLASSPLLALFRFSYGPVG